MFCNDKDCNTYEALIMNTTQEVREAERIVKTEELVSTVVGWNTYDVNFAWLNSFNTIIKIVYSALFRSGCPTKS